MGVAGLPRPLERLQRAGRTALGFMQEAAPTNRIFYGRDLVRGYGMHSQAADLQPSRRLEYRRQAQEGYREQKGQHGAL